MPWQRRGRTGANQTDDGKPHRPEEVAPTGTEALSDGWPRLREGEALARLLTHYADLGAADREAWQDRRMDLEGVEPRELVRLHGQLRDLAGKKRTVQ